MPANLFRPTNIVISNLTNRGHGPLLQQNKPRNRALRRGRVSIPHHVYLVTTVTQKRQPFFSDFYAGCTAARCFEDRAILGDADMLAWVLMPDHAHWLIQLGENDTLAKVVNRLKSASARLVNRKLVRQGSLWKSAYHDHALRADEDLKNVARYLVANPLRAGLVKRIDDYPFWDAVWV